MDERRANIDIAFRNGLKDYEVLPPPEVWDTIHPLIKRKRSLALVLRAAAVIAMLLTLSVFAYRWRSQVSSDLNSAVVAVNSNSSLSGNEADLVRPVSVAVNENKSIGNTRTVTVENTPLKVTAPVEISNIENIDAQNPDGIIYPPEANYFNIDRTSSQSIQHRISLDSYGQNTFTPDNLDQEIIPQNNIVKETHRWSISAMASPTFYGKVNSGNDELSTLLKNSEQAVVSYSGGVALSYKLNRRFSIQSGLFYSSLGQEVMGINSFGGFRNFDYTKGDHNFEVRTTNGIVYTRNSDVFLLAEGPGGRLVTNYTNDVFDPQKASLDYINNTLHQNFSYLELPIVVRYKVIDKAIDINLIGGISYNLLIDNSVYTVIDGGKYPIGTTEGLNTLSISSSLGMGMEYKFSDKLSLNLEPTFRYYMNPYTNMRSTHPYSFGIFSGVSYKF